MSADLRPYRPRGGGVDTFDPSDCPTEHRFHAFIQRYDEFLWRVPRPGGKAAWIWWRELSPGCPRALIGDELPHSEFTLRRAAQWFSDNGQAIPPVLAADIAREREAQAAASVGPAPPVGPPAIPVDANPAGPADPWKDAPRVIMGPLSPLLGDPDWIVAFRWMTERLLGTARKLARHGSMSPYCHMLIETEWKPTLDGLAAHVWKVREDSRNGPPIRIVALQGNVPDAYQLAYAMLGEISRNDRPGVAPIPITTLEAIYELLADWQAPAVPSPSVGSDGRTKAAADHPALPPEAEPARLSNRSGTPVGPPIEHAPASPAGSPRADRQAAGADAKPKRARRPRRISKVQKAIVVLNYRAKNERESIRVEDIAREAECSAQNLYKSLEFKREWDAARARRARRGWKIEGVADCPDDSTLDVG